MIRGAIETASRSTISGWLYSQKLNLHGQVLLAFLGDRHVGSGRIEIFRKDILQAGLGDGFSGFYFPVDLRPGENPQDMTVRLEACDLALLHPGSTVVAREAKRTTQVMAGPAAAFAGAGGRVAGQWGQA
jgi:hypothetical protein